MNDTSKYYDNYNTHNDNYSSDDYDDDIMIITDI